MRLTQQTDTSVRILMYCATHPGTTRIRDVAAAYQVSELNLFKIMRPLVESGIVESIRGRKGGIRLARPASEISLGEVVRATETNLNLADCFETDHRDCLLVDACGFNNALREALKAFLAVLDRYSIADLATDRSALRRLLEGTGEGVIAVEARPLQAH
ncbi:MAG: Rrf2 family transcriptional regulator [Bauldia sp.]|nr:Rrf2 family transcriptional regulator [Bauldia sp.]